MPVQSSSHDCFGSGLRPLRMSQTRTPSPYVQPMFFDGIWKVGVVSARWASAVTTVVCVSVATTTVTVSVLPPPHAARAGTSPRRRTSRRTHGSLVLHVPQLTMAATPLLSRLRAQARVPLQVKRPELPLELEIAVEALRGERPVRDRRSDRTAGPVGRGAVGELAAGGELGGVWESRVEHGFGCPERELAHPRCVEEESAARQRLELAVRRRVPAAAVLARLCG